MAHLTLTNKERVLLISIPLISSASLVLKHYMAIPDAVYGLFTGISLGIGIILTITLLKRRSMQKSKRRNE